ncbi:MAG: hypothetical protein ACYTG6_13490 [Planctomycetota bacterium]
MRRATCWCIAVGVGLLLGIGPAAGEDETPALELPFEEVDFTTVERAIAKEPAYVAEPRYALFLFGPRAEAWMWAVLDKSDPELAYYDVLYFDRNANGDLTEDDERITGTYREAGAAAGMALVIKVGRLPVPGTSLVHEDVLVSTIRKTGRTGIWFRMKWNGEVTVSGGTTTRGDATAWGEGPESAPILRPTPLGRLSFAFYGWGVSEVTWTIGEDARIYLMAGNPGSRTDTLCPVDEEFLDLEKDKIVATLIARDAEGNEVRSIAEIDGHC